MFTPTVVPDNPIQGLLMALSQLMCSLSSGEGCMIIQ